MRLQSGDLRICITDGGRGLTRRLLPLFLLFCCHDRPQAGLLVGGIAADCPLTLSFPAWLWETHSPSRQSIRNAPTFPQRRTGASNPLSDCAIGASSPHCLDIRSLCEVVRSSTYGILKLGTEFRQSDFATCST